MKSIEAEIGKLLKQETCLLGDVLPNKAAMQKNDLHMDSEKNKRISAAKKELPLCEYKLVRVGRLGVEHRLYRNKVQWTDADSQKTGARRSWFEQRQDGVYPVK